MSESQVKNIVECGTESANRERILGEMVRVVPAWGKNGPGERKLGRSLGLADCARTNPGFSNSTHSPSPNSILPPFFQEVELSLGPDPPPPPTSLAKQVKQVKWPWTNLDSSSPTLWMQKMQREFHKIVWNMGKDIFDTNTFWTSIVSFWIRLSLFQPGQLCLVKWFHSLGLSGS